jgi:ribonuclease I
MSHVHIDMSAQMRRARALELRVQGKQWKEIATICGYKNASDAFKATQQMLDQHVIPAVEEYRKLSEMRLDAMLAAIWPRVTGERVIDNETGAYLSGEIDLDCMAMALKIEARRAKLLGLDAKVDMGDFPIGQVLIREIAAPVDKV